MKVLGVGLSRTGTHSLGAALHLLGYRTVHYDDKRLNDILLGYTRNPEFSRYDDLDAVVDIPSALFYREILAAYPDCKAILTIRDIESWVESMRLHLQAYDEKVFNLPPPHINIVQVIREIAWGTWKKNEFLWRKRYTEHNEAVQRDVKNLLVMDITQGDGWEKLCPYLGVEIPDVPFPDLGKSDPDKKIYLKPSVWNQ